MQVRNKILILALPIVLCVACRTARVDTDSNLTPSDRLLHQLECCLEKGVMLGHQDDLAYGCMWYDMPNASDFNGVSGEYPAVFGWDIGNLEIGGELNPDSVNIAKIKQYIVKADSLGAVSTVRWSASPVEHDASLADLLPGGACNEKYRKYLDCVASFLHSLLNAQGDEIAVIFQPLYCPNACSNWWRCTQENEIETYKQAWTYTVKYLRENAGVDNALFAFSLASPADADDWNRYYPGDDCVDIMGVDVIADPSESIDSFNHDFNAGVESLTAFADEHHKLPAVTATGMVGVKTPGFFTHYMAETLDHHHLSYVMLWKNSWKEENLYFVPLKGHPVADDFKHFVDSDNILTCSDLAAMAGHHENQL